MRTTFLKKGAREIWAHKFQYMFLVLVLGLGVAAFGSLNDMSASRYTTFDTNYRENRFQDLRLEFQYGATSNITAVETLLSDPSIAGSISDCELRFAFNVFLEHPDGDSTRTSKGTIMGYQTFEVDGTPREITVNRPLFFSRGVRPFSSTDPDECYLEHNFASVYDLRDGGRTLKVLNGEREFELLIIKEVAIPEYYLVMKEGSFSPQHRSLGVVMVTMATAQRIYGSPEGETLVNNIAIRLKEPETLEAFKKNITDLFELNGIPLKAIEKEEDTARFFIKDDMEGDEKIFRTFPIVIFTVSGFGLFMALRRMVQTHKVQIGIFKSLGVPDRFVLLYFASIGAMVAVLGVLLGLLLSVPLNIWFQSIIEQFFGFPIMDYSISWRYYVGGTFISMFLCLACTLVPAWRALKVRPVDAIQQREGLSKRKVGRFAAKVGPHSMVPTSIKLALRNVLRKPGRTMTSVLGVGLALSLFLSFLIITESMVVLIDDWNEVNQWDYEVETEGFYPINATTGWKMENPEIEQINPGIMLPTELYNGKDSAKAMVYALNDVEGAFKMELEKGSIRQGELVISVYQRDLLGTGIGDTVEIFVPVMTPGVGLVMTRKEVVVSGVQTNHIGYYSFMDLTTLQNMTGLIGLANIIFLETSNGERSDSLEDDLIREPGISTVQHVSQIGNLIEEYYDLFMAVVYALSVISTAMAAAIIYNLFMISAEERKRDFATMKTLGTSLSKVGRLILLEASFITVPGIAVGAAGGWALAYYMMNVANTMDYINFKLVWSWSGFIMGTIIMTVVVTVVSLITLRYISRIIIANVIRERSTG